MVGAKSIKSETATMQQLQERNDNIERDVQRYRERKNIEREVGLCSPSPPFHLQ
jgi:hypothetical protein